MQAVRVGKYKLLRSLPGQQSMGMDLWCDVCLDGAETGGCATGLPAGKVVPYGGTVCRNVTGNATVAALGPSYAPVLCDGSSSSSVVPAASSAAADSRDTQLPTAAGAGAAGAYCWLFDLDADPTEANNLAATEPAVLTMMLGKLAGYQRGNAPCCSCTLTPDMAEMSLPPKDGVWFTFHDEADPSADDAPLCDLLREPPANSPPPSALPA